MIDVQPARMKIADWLVMYPGMTVGASQLSLLTDEVYLWVELTGPVTRATLREALYDLRRFSSFKLLVNVDSLDKTAVRFAEFFGFKTVAQHQNVLIMEKN